MDGDGFWDVCLISWSGAVVYASRCSYSLAGEDSFSFDSGFADGSGACTISMIGLGGEGSFSGDLALCLTTGASAGISTGAALATPISAKISSLSSG